MLSRTKRTICALLGAAMVALSACGAQTTQSEGEYIEGHLAGTDVAAGAAADSVFSLNSKAADGFNPYVTTNTDNRLADRLVYENIFDVDDDYNLTSRVITDYKDTDGTYWYFTVDTSIKMHDGSNLTAKDVAYSLQRAMQSSRYTGRFSYVWGASASSDSEFAVSLSIADKLFPYLLTVPVIKYGSAAEDTPAGTGPYKFAEDKKSLVAFDGYPDWQHLPVDTVYLKEYSTIETTISAYEDSYIDLVFNDPSGSSDLGYGGSNEVRYYTTNNMHYLGLNMKSDFFRETALRYAMQYAVDREYAATTLMNGAAAPAALPISPNSPLYNYKIADNLKYDLEKCSRILQNGGVADYDQDGALEYMLTGIAMEIDLKLIVCSENAGKADIAKKMAEDLGTIGIKVTVRELSWTDYQTALADGDFDLYYGEVKLTADFSLTRLLTEDGDLNYCSIEDPLYQEYIYQYLAAGDDTRKDYCDQMLQYIQDTAPIIPICFEKHQIITHRNVITGMKLSQYNVFLNFPEWNINFG